eukprot:CAMPEP_0194331658 /NCGR_PEP_ID=MMETSP0171-20130528/56353_1 /TAXON_ID=218684 /ORGANISM="Corethron pennatum, Strain L29A3" /LENGTH=96 /DNA_ID=CAMNT_0039093201 /DNA_START=20 /DNA_END=310 /DNA_ORIENTATION=+
MADEFADVEVGPEPAAGARVQIRKPDGKRVVRRFEKEGPVRALYAFIVQSDDDAQAGRPFVLKAGFPPKDLIGDIDGTFESCGLDGGAVQMVWRVD